jgi:hypothetical protein
LLGARVIVSFQSEKLHDCCCQASLAEEALGSAHAQDLATLIAEAEAVETADEFLQLRAPLAHITEDDSLLAEVGADYAARFVAAGQEFTRDEEGKIVWSSVRRVKLVTLETAT